MGLQATLALLAAGLALAAFARWRETRPREPGELHMLPTTPLLAVGVLASVLAAAHLVTLLTGRPPTGRFGP